MLKKLWIILATLTLTTIFGFASCDTDDEDTDETTDENTDEATDENTDEATDDPTELEYFGEACITADDCDPEGVCHEFGQIGLTCTIECDEDTDCPEGSEGAKCNKQNLCRP